MCQNIKIYIKTIDIFIKITINIRDLASRYMNQTTLSIEVFVIFFENYLTMLLHNFVLKKLRFYKYTVHKCIVSLTYIMPILT